MEIKNRLFKPFIKFNIFLIPFLYADLFNPFNQKITEEFAFFYTSVETTPGYRTSSSTQFRHLLVCRSDNTYYLGELPTSEQGFTPGSVVTVTKTLILRKVAFITNQKGQSFLVSFLWVKIVLGIFGVCLLLTILNVFLANKVLEYMLSFSSALVYCIVVAYIFCY